MFILACTYGSLAKFQLVIMATGGAESSAVRESLDAETEARMDELFERLRKLPERERRSTLYFMNKVDSESDRDVRSKERTDREVVRERDGGAVAERVQSTVVVHETGLRKIKNFSGSVRCSGGEVDYKHWKRSALQIACDPDLTANKKRVLILQSLTGEADDNVELVRDKSASEIIKFLDTIYGSVSGQHDLMSRFYQCVQARDQTASQYLTTLYRALGEMVREEVLCEEQMNELLVRQFIRGTSDESMIVKLGLKDDDKIEFPGLVTKIRKEEEMRSIRESRVKRAGCKSGNTSEDSNKVEKEGAKQEGEIRELLEGIKCLQTMVASQRSTDRPKPFCYRCGQNGHFATKCKNTPNAQLVMEKKQARDAFYAQNPKNY